MVSSAPLTASKSQNTLSYAERAKKGHSAKLPKAASSQQHPTASQNHSISSTATAPSVVASTSSTDMTGSSGSKASSPLSSVDMTPGSQQAKGSAEPSAGVLEAGESSSSAQSQSSPVKSPPVNVWNVRKEQMAQAFAQSRSPQKPAAASSPVHINGTGPSYPPLSHSSGQIQASMSTSRPPALNGTSVNVKDAVEDDPFVVKPRTRLPPTPPASLPPSVEDVESWPEVGKSIQPSPPGEVEKTEEKRPGETSQPATPRKGEKTKWVPIPAEELQAAADAVRPRNRYGSSRNQAPYHNRQGSARNSLQASTSTSASGSVPASQGHSRAHSTRGSASQSQVQSVASSVQSSPRQSVRGKRLPEEPTGTSGYGRPLNVESSLPGGAPPHTEMPMPYPPPQIAPYASSQGSGTNSPGYFPHLSLPVQPGHSPHTHAYPMATSPAHNPYAMPASNGYPSQPGVVSPMYPGSPPYPMYQPYMYPYGQPYPYWNGNAPGQEQLQPMYPTSSQVSPIPPPVQDPVQIQAGAEPSAPPPTSMVRPPPPGESEAVAGYREVGPVETATSSAQEASQRGRPQRPVVFGSITSKSPSPAPVESTFKKDVKNTASAMPEETATGDQATEKEEGIKTFKTIAIGVSPGEPGPSTRSRTQSSSKGRRRVETAPGRFMSDVMNNGDPVKNGEGPKEENKVEFKVIDLTDPETKWEFGSTMRNEPDEALLVPPQPGRGPSPHLSQPSPVRAPDGISAAASMSASLSTSSASPATSASGLPSGPGMPVPYPFPADQSLQPEYNAESDEWEVKDYGYGFGPMSGTGIAPVITKEERIARERERERARNSGREFGMRARGYSHSFESGYGYERGRRGRGRGGPRGYGRGGYDSRNFSRGGGFQQSRQSGYNPNVTPPSHFQQLPPQADYGTQYYVPPIGPYGPVPGYEGYHPAAYVPPIHIPQTVPPAPAPISAVSFPLDPFRQSLLGQLEYYLSPQNMAQDFFLRQRMDSLGWVSVHLLASFNRVRHLTVDIDLVKDVLSLSSAVELRDDWVRMGGDQWKQFVLPGAAKSHFESDAAPGQAEAPSHSSAEHNPSSSTSSPEDMKSADIEAEEEEEEDVVFVMGQHTDGPWKPQQQPAS
ncbi:hypothetical protein GLOTRDRAFT_139687 [Gloeophyllum trabeum ATCC 11539]|uniref:HTH La-type RNA-binding domain-containing protein n=1 Tax=Gloeophyllum trabeum (strain ATCC 11539 / FP-39264 / Madison 617) TaxID=670483 RepID=S7Q125_GLOTA|nr:uncharacterized protein GLOTRDRAFT_139687 [Gloeophyllum trabeum ATCC 11539]EPQ53448.1 hypothetical protein GLOTRDRAFT_139687 [Gloeophyllum trabeum ATCC 11539]